MQHQHLVLLIILAIKHNTGTVLAQAAFNSSNIINGIDVTQNTAITVIQGTHLQPKRFYQYSK
jgi:hypothetical protein